MPARRHILLISVVLVALLLTAIVLQWQQRTRHTPQQHGLLLPELSAVLNDINRIELISSAESTFLQVENDRWVVVQRADYPADVGKIRKLLIELSEAEILEPKTASQSRYHLIGVQDPTEQAQARGVIVRLFTGNERQKAALILGEPSQQRDGRFVRRYGEKQTWLVSADIRATADPASWIDNTLLSIDSERLKHIEITPVGSRAYRLTRPDNNTEWQIESPPTRQAVKAGMLHRIAGTVMNLTAVDVQDQAPATSWRKAVFTTNDGLVVNLELQKNEGAYLLRLGSGVERTVAESQQAIESVTQESAAINQRYKDRIYQIPPYEGRILFHNYKDLLKDNEE